MQKIVHSSFQLKQFDAPWFFKILFGYRIENQIVIA